MRTALELSLTLLLALQAGSSSAQSWIAPVPADVGSGKAQSGPVAGTVYHIERGTLRPGGASQSANFGVRGTMGQADAGVLNGPTFRIEGGFWVSDSVAPPLGDAVFNDGFEGH